jgi:hypothetical protein
MATRDENGRFIKGTSGNKGGRRKVEKLDAAFFKKLKGAKSGQETAQLLIDYLLETLTDRNDIDKFMTKYAKYLVPAKKSVETEIRQQTKFVIEWQEPAKLEQPKDVTTVEGTTDD